MSLYKRTKNEANKLKKYPNDDDDVDVFEFKFDARDMVMKFLELYELGVDFSYKVSGIEHESQRICELFRIISGNSQPVCFWSRRWFDS